MVCINYMYFNTVAVSDEKLKKYTSKHYLGGRKYLPEDTRGCQICGPLVTR